MSQENVEIVRAIYDDVGNAATARRSPSARPRRSSRACAQDWPDAEQRTTGRGMSTAWRSGLSAWDGLPHRGRASSRRWATACSSSRGSCAGRRRAAAEVDSAEARRASRCATEGHPSCASIFDHDRGPQSRGAGGVGDVAGERGDRAARL